MREIKFRAWDNENGCWYKPTHEAYNGKLFELLVSFSGQLTAHTMHGLDHESLWPNRFVLMQYTGLKDKNGKEIYEGDLLKKEDTNNARVVKWTDQNGAYFVLSNSATEKVVWDDCLTKDRIETFGYEIIGNIYENPELLK